MVKLLKWGLVAVSFVLVVAAVAAITLYWRGGARLSRQYDVAVAEVSVPDDSASVTRGRHLAEAVTLCQGCHGEDLSGDVLVDEPGLARIYASNLTAGRGGVGTRYADADYVRAIRHGVNAEGRGLMIMHSDAYHHLDARDLAALIAYVRSAPPVDHEVPTTRVGLLGRVFVALGMFDSENIPLVPAEVIDHDAPVETAPPEGPTAEYGGYLVSIALCRMCHGPDLTGGVPIEEGAPPGPNIAAYAASGGWTDAQFIETIRTGVTPYERALNAEYMPWEAYGRMSDDELLAIWRYLGSLSSP